MGAEVRKVPSPLPSSTDTVLDPLLVTTRSGRPSRLKSPTAMDVGVAVAAAGAAREGPSPFPRNPGKGVGPFVVTAQNRKGSPLESPPAEGPRMAPTRPPSAR